MPEVEAGASRSRARHPRVASRSRTTSSRVDTTPFVSAGQIGVYPASRAPCGCPNGVVPVKEHAELAFTVARRRAALLRGVSIHGRGRAHRAEGREGPPEGSPKPRPEWMKS